jgi:hypothetical protein
VLDGMSWGEGARQALGFGGIYLDQDQCTKMFVRFALHRIQTNLHLGYNTDSD